MKNNKGQALIVFVLCLPIFIFFAVYIFDIILINYEKNKFNSIVHIAKNELKKNNDNSICELIIKNDSNIVCYEDDNKVSLNKEFKILFGNVINRRTIKLKNEIPR